ncbi:YciI family protein [Aggregicoccus sp. 17bor-14]|uniref:YciI family protein n=1 Tax=Myxococcaceae TaxID=31 RepID=UPI00129CC9F8|nr:MULTISPECIES: YciI family protein [Myxococcaceae]MBF5041638.1 YciI family protein [Simulacricoccus sp. 17bor-14]MRI87422.1 YciI family protein [Aggregicoccus sp. 17bor-14]
MLYAILCVHDEQTVFGWSKQEDDALMERLEVVHQKLAAQGRLGPAARLGPTTSASTVRRTGRGHTVTDGPFAETKEQILGFYIVDCASQEEANEVARELQEINTGATYEVRPVRLFKPGMLAR